MADTLPVEPWRQAEINAEAAADEAVVRLAREIAATVTTCPSVFRWGDGHGGHIFRTVGDALAAAGFHATSTWQQPTLVNRIAQRDGWTCHYCERSLGWGHPLVRRPEVEHVVPKGQGGTDVLANLVLACGPCNSSKGNRTPLEWLGRPCCGLHA